MILTVKEGDDKPYNAKDQGIYIRSMATSRIATLYELKQMNKTQFDPYR